MSKHVGLVTKRGEISYDEFVTYWRGAHADLAKELPGLRNYVINPIDKRDSLQRMDPRQEQIVGTAIAGIGFGAGVQSGLRMLLAKAAPEHRAGLLSTIYVISYLAFGLPSVVAGIVDPYTGLVAAFTGYGVLVIAAAFVALIVQLSSHDSVEADAAAAVKAQETCFLTPPSLEL